MATLSIAVPFAPHLRIEFAARYRENRRRTAELFALIEHAMYERPLVRRLPFIFYLGHLPVFSYVTLAQAYGLPPLDADFETLFRRGIDPSTDAEADDLQPQNWPSVDEVHAYGRKADAAILALIDRASLIDDTNSLLVGSQAWFTILEHEVMHQETLLYLVTCLRDGKKTLPVGLVDTGRASGARSEVLEIAAGRTVIGAATGSIRFGWDNEFGAQSHSVERFFVDSQPITNRRYAAFVEQGAAPPFHWFRRDNAWWLRTILGAIPLPLDWPVYVSQHEAQSFASASGARLMTEPEYQHVAYGSPSGRTRRFPWGDALPTSRHANLNFQRMLPEPIGATPAGGSAWGVHELVGNGWEITATPFAPLPGFKPMASYPAYSNDFFDGRHYVVKGASAVTAADILRPTLRNWFYDDYPYAFTKFRLAYSR